MDSIFIEAIEFYGYHGLLDDEQAVGHRYVADVELSADTRRSAQSDNLADTIDYAAVARRVVEIGTKEKHRLIESIAERLATVILEEFAAESVRIRLKKISPPFNVIAQSVGVEIRRDRSR